MHCNIYVAKNKGVDQLLGYNAADLQLVFFQKQKAGFFIIRLNIVCIAKQPPYLGLKQKECFTIFLQRPHNG